MRSLGGDIDLEKRIITVSKTLQRVKCFDNKTKTRLIITEPKSESSMRMIPIPDCITDYLTDLKKGDDVYILSGRRRPVEPRTMQYRFAKVLKNAGLPSVHFHSLRHLFTSSCIELGFDIKTLSLILGHSSVELTLNRYVHTSLDRKRRCMALLT